MADPATIINSKVPAPDTGLRLVAGIVVTTSPLTVRVGAATTATSALKMSWYTPVVGHKVQILHVEGVRVVLGTIG